MGIDPKIVGTKMPGFHPKMGKSPQIRDTFSEARNPKSLEFAPKTVWEPKL